MTNYHVKVKGYVQKYVGGTKLYFIEEYDIRAVDNKSARSIAKKILNIHKDNPIVLSLSVVQNTWNGRKYLK